MAGSPQVRHSCKVNRIQDLYSVPSGGGGTFQGEAFECGDWRDFKTRDWVFIMYSRGTGPVLSIVRVFCEWKPAGGPQGDRNLATLMA